MKYKEIEEKLSKKYSTKIGEVKLDDLRKIITDKEYEKYLKSFSIYLTKWLENNEKHLKNVSSIDSFEIKLINLIKKNIQQGISYDDVFMCLLHQTLSIGVEQYEKEELLYNLRIVMNQVMAEKYIEFKMLNAPEMLQ